MYFLTIKTDNEFAELGIYSDSKKSKYIKWNSGRNLSIEINSKIEELLKSANLNYSKLSGIVIYSGPGSFTGLRIGFITANTLSYSLSIPILKMNGKSWQVEGIKKLLKGDNNYPVMPDYGAEPHITTPIK